MILNQLFKTRGNLYSVDGFKWYTESQLLTPWMLGHSKPVRDGVYVQHSGGKTPMLGFQRFENRCWHSWSSSLERAQLTNIPCYPHHQNDQWRGLTKLGYDLLMGVCK
ncbi:MAG: hypothetical protein KGI54_08755 [Pseudomonadota bacterium]|nr:hypothetical protein [Pseudomonadota bacterium]